jgi:hypothetical protein
VVVTDNPALISALQFSANLKPIEIPSRLQRWTDDYNSLLPILKLRRDDP